jgi:hypothetical protein
LANSGVRGNSTSGNNSGSMDISSSVDVPSCDCGTECTRLTSNSQKNPGRAFYKCAGGKCEAFFWADAC